MPKLCEKSVILSRTDAPKRVITKAALAKARMKLKYSVYQDFHAKVLMKNIVSLFVLQTDRLS
jgi:hypothetical protein